MSLAGSAGKRIVLGVSGGIAAYKACELLRRLRALGHDVTVVPTPAALTFIGAATFEALSGHPVATDVFTDVPAVKHVVTGQQADLVIVAPASADLLARAATGMADDLLTATLLVTRAPVLMAPAMHTEMWTHPATVANVATLRARGVIVIPPAIGRLTGADSGAGRLPDPGQLTQLVELALHPAAAAGSPLRYDLADRHLVVSAGGTREALDPVRYLGNFSSGRQGYAIAMVAAARGATVTLIAANTTLTDPPGVQVHRVTTAAELQTAVQQATQDADAVVMAAAVADFRPSQPAAHKIKKTAGAAPVIELVENSDILAGLVAARSSAALPVIAGFAAETGDGSTSPLEFGRQKMTRKGCDLLVVNRVDEGRAFEVDDNAAVILNAAGGCTDVPFGPKTVLAAAVCDAVVTALDTRRASAATQPADSLSTPESHASTEDIQGAST